jgi:hypothetical protein
MKPSLRLNIEQFLRSINDASLAGKIFISPSIRTSLVNAPSSQLTSASGAISQTELQNILTLAGKGMVLPAQAKSALDLQISTGAIDMSCGVIAPGSPATLNSVSSCILVIVNFKD